jgi:hypothetical protein
MNIANTQGVQLQQLTHEQKRHIDRLMSIALSNTSAPIQEIRDELFFYIETFMMEAREQATNYLEKAN